VTCPLACPVIHDSGRRRTGTQCPGFVKPKGPHTTPRRSRAPARPPWQQRTRRLPPALADTHARTAAWHRSTRHDWLRPGKPKKRAIRTPCPPRVPGVRPILGVKAQATSSERRPSHTLGRRCRTTHAVAMWLPCQAHRPYVRGCTHEHARTTPTGNTTPGKKEN
jgi:hypothetical protein